jgi:hypothetical protein
MKRILIVVFVMTSFIYQSCHKHKDVPPAPVSGILNGKVTNPSSTGIGGAQIIVFDANTNAPVTTLTTAADGTYSVELYIGNYYIKVYAQNYMNIPGPGLSGLPFTIHGGGTTTNNYQMETSTLLNTGYITGLVTAGSSPVGGVLIVANDGTNGYSSVSDALGKYVIFNVPTGSYTVNGWRVSYNSSQVSISVAGGAETANVNILLTSGASGSVSGSITFLATTNIETDVSLVNPYTREAIPGMSTRTNGSNYIINYVPNGSFIGRASYTNDGKVMDPDYIVKFGEPTITVAGATYVLNFSVTGAVTLISPTNSANFTSPVKVNTTLPSFSWNDYPSTDDYVIEVMNSNGVVVWGGFSGSGANLTKNVSIPKTTTSVVYNFDGTAIAPLETGKVYRWRIYASKDCLTCSPAWTLISMSEDQMGLIIP